MDFGWRVIGVVPEPDENSTERRILQDRNKEVNEESIKTNTVIIQLEFSDPLSVSSLDRGERD